MSKKNNPKGVVLISVLIVVALISSSVVLMFKHQNATTDNLQRINWQSNALQYAFSLEEFAKALLKTDKQEEQQSADYLDEDWAKAFAFGIDHGRFEAQLFDLQAGVNLNNLFEFNTQSGQMTEKITPDFFGCFDRLNLALDSNITAESLMHYLNENNLKQITHLSELKKINGIRVEDYQKIRSFLFTLNDVTTININTASDEVLGCLHPQLSSSSVIEVIKSGRPYQNKNDFYTQLQGLMSLELDKIKMTFDSFVDVQSRYFVLRGKITIEQLTLNISSFFKRNNNKISLINRSYYLDNAAY